MKTGDDVPEFHSLLPGAFFYTAIVLTMVKFINPIINHPDLPQIQILSGAMMVAWYLKKNDGKAFFCNLTSTITLLGLGHHTVNSTWIWTCVGLAASTKVFELGLLRFAKQRRRTTTP